MQIRYHSNESPAFNTWLELIVTSFSMMINGVVIIVKAILPVNNRTPNEQNNQAGNSERRFD